MAYPPPVPPTGRSNVTPQKDNHPNDHNAISAALTDILNELGSDPSMGRTSLTALLTEIIGDMLAPIGVILPYGGSVAPPGHALCQGQLVPKAPNPVLTSRYGTIYGPGDANNITMPNVQGRSFMGYWPGGVWAATLGQMIGSADAVLVSHGHGGRTGHEGGVDHLHSAGALAGPVHDHNYGDGTRHWWLDPNAWAIDDGALAPENPGGAKFGLADWHAGGGGAVTGSSGPADRVLNHSHGVTAEGVSGTNANIPPSIVVNGIVRLG